ncbi:MAG: hypothetical protein FWH19_02815 [Treponema sp.]|nr:hypothetical protein [Treponema sp.]
MDPEIAALLGVAVNERPEPAKDAVLDYSELFADETIKAGPQPVAADEPVLGMEGFPTINRRLEDTPHSSFEDPEYYKKALANEGDISQRVHGLLQKYLKCKDPKDKSVFRQQLIPAVWEFIFSVGRKAPGGLQDPKKYLLRYGLLHPTLLKQDHRTFFAKIILNNTYDLPVYYLDEWLKAVGTGKVANSSTDEVRTARSNRGMQLQSLLEKAKGKLDGCKVLLQGKNRERLDLEKRLVEQAAIVADHYAVEGLPGVSSCYTEVQKRTIIDIQELTKRLIRADREQDNYIRDYLQAEKDVKTIVQKAEEEDAALEVDVRAVDTECDTIRQMAKMTIGRQGNHFPILTSEYFHCQPGDVAHRENVIAVMSWIESVDAEAFCRSHRSQLNRIVPYVVLVPCYGDIGFCWEPFDRRNRATSRGRIAIPMYPRNITIALLTAVADLRWQVAKEKASYYWMEEGITGHYYQYFQKMKMKGDLKESFIQDYIQWVVKESDGIQKLDKELRGTFWRYMPFTQAVKDRLRDRSYVYQELYQRDLNRLMSDGY